MITCISQAFVSVGESIIVMNNVSYITIQGLQMLYSRTIAVEAYKGCQHVVMYIILYGGIFEPPGFLKLLLSMTSLCVYILPPGYKLHSPDIEPAQPVEQVCYI